MRVLGIDYGARRVGLAVSDASGTLARPLLTLDRGALPDDGRVVGAVLDIVARLADEGDPVRRLVVGLPRRLDGSANDQTPKVEGFVRLLAARAGLPVTVEDERLSSREAESRLALREKNWRRRKEKLDAAAAAVILQDYLDRQHPALLDPDGA